MKKHGIAKRKNLSPSLIRIMCGIVFLILSAIAQAQKVKPGKGYVVANGVNMYYEITGTGEPVLLLHGGLMSTGSLSPILPALTANRQVIAVDLYGHGRTALTGRPITHADMANDVAALLQKLGYDSVDVIGYSMGGGVGLRLAIQHPAAVRKLVLVSVTFARDGFYPDILQMQEQLNAGAAEMMKQTPLYQSYAAIAPKPDDFGKLIEAIGNMMRKPYDWSAEVKKIKLPVMLVYGDADMIRPEHMVQFYQLLGGGQKDAGWNREQMPANRLAVIPDKTHYEIGVAPEMIQAVLPFLNGKAK